MTKAIIYPRLQPQMLALSAFAVVAVACFAVAVTCFAMAMAPDGAAASVAKPPSMAVPSPASRPSPWMQLADLRRRLNGPVSDPAALTAMVATLDGIIAGQPDAAVVESAGQLKAECWTRLGDKQAALDAFLAHADQIAPEERDAAAWHLVRSARREARNRGAFLASQQLDEFFAHFTDTRADDAALLLAAQVHQELGDRDAAIGFYRTHLARHPASPMREFTSLCLASLYQGKRDPERAAAIRADWEAERIRRANAPAPQQPPTPAPATLKPCTACGN